MTRQGKVSLLAGVSALVLGSFVPAVAQDAPATPAPAVEQETAIERITVTGQIFYRDRTTSVAPTLEYDTRYFQPFEPLTVGDALKRVPSVAFLSDVLESDGVRLRGLDPAYTQIMINGELVPGAGSSSGAFGNGADGAFFVDRIPAELIDSIEIVRSGSANRSGDAMAGGINIVLREAYTVDGGYIRAGALYWDNAAKLGGTGGIVWGGEALGGRLLVGANVQDRHNPKEKFSARHASNTSPSLINIEDQTDTRDGTDYSANFNYVAEIGTGELSLDGFWVKTDRYEDEDSIEFRNPVAGSIVTAASLRNVAGNLLTLNDNNVAIDQESVSINGGYKFDMFGGRTKVRAGYANFTTFEDEFEFEMEYLRDAVPYPEADRFTADFTQLDIDDTEETLKIEHERELSATVALEFGVHYHKKTRDFLNRERARWRTGSGGVPALPAGINIPTATGAGLPVPIALNPFAATPGGDNTVERTRIDPFVMFTGTGSALAWEAGLRYETFETDVTDRTVVGGNSSTSEEILLPSAHLKYNVTESDRILVSVARTVRRPSFDFITPAVLEEELGENDFRGNPGLKPETAWGIDVGYERRLGKAGIVGVNVFYRDVQDLIEIVTRTVGGVPVVGSAGPGTFEMTAQNTGDGTVWGIEFDLSTPLTVFGLPDTGVFLNYSWLDSDVSDQFGSRRFNSQAESVFNVGFIHEITAWGSSFGVTYRKQGSAYSRVVGEEVTTTYDGDLEVFVEQEIGTNFVLRFTGSNLLNANKDELFNKFNTIADQQTRAFDEYEYETESAGPVFQIVGRYAF